MTTSAEDSPADRARQIVDGLGEGFLSLDAGWRITDCNRAVALFLQRRRQDLLGGDFWAVSGAAKDSPFSQLAQRVAESREAEDAEVAYTRQGAKWLFSAQVFPLDGGIGVVWRDITEIRAAQIELAETEARYRELADGTPAAAWLSGPDGELEFINQAMADAFGRSREALLTQGWMDAIDPDDRPAMMKARAEAWTTQSPFVYEGRFRHTDGGLRILELKGRPRFDAKGGFRGYAGMATDVTEARAAQAQQQLLLNELNHRVKNTLATVLSLVRQTLREGGDPAEIERRVTARLQALATAHDVLTQESWTGAELSEIARTALRPFADAGRLSIEGPEARFGPNITIALSMALHELATNALKYGALSSPEGRVRLTWTTSGRSVSVEWRESGGPAVTPPEHTGFGVLLLSRGLGGELSRPAELIWAPDGVICRMQALAEREDGASSEA